MKIMYAARMCRFDLLRAVQGLARFLTKWIKQQDAELYRLICYMHTTKSWRMLGWVGDDIGDVEPYLFSDADFVGCRDQKSTAN